MKNLALPLKNHETRLFDKTVSVLLIDDISPWGKIENRSHKGHTILAWSGSRYIPICITNTSTMPITLFDIAIKTLETAKMPLTAEEIWVKSEELKTRAGFESKGKTPVASISARCYMEIQTKGEQSKLYQHSTRPTTFYLTKWKGQYIAKETAEDDNKAEPITKIGWKERDLHPLLTAFVRANPHFCAWTKTIYHERSKLGIQGQNHWLFPDLVGVHFPLEYRKEVLDIQKELSANSVRIFSFEMKRYLGLSNLRESYFQAISNSSWANEGYLVALDFAEEGEFQEELRRLNSAFGIGIFV